MKKTMIFLGEGWGGVCEVGAGREAPCSVPKAREGACAKRTAEFTPKIKNSGRTIKLKF